MQAGKSAMDSAKETVANIAASAKSGMEKTKAVIGEKVEKMSATDAVEMDMATLRKEDKIRQAELLKQQAYLQNAAAAAGGTESYTAMGTMGQTQTTTGTQTYAAATDHSHADANGATTRPIGHVDSTGGVTGAGTNAGTGGVPDRNSRTGPEP